MYCSFCDLSSSYQKHRCHSEFDLLRFYLPEFRMTALLVTDQISLKTWILCAQAVHTWLDKKQVGNCLYHFFGCPELILRARELQDAGSETNCCSGTECFLSWALSQYNFGNKSMFGMRTKHFLWFWFKSKCKAFLWLFRAVHRFGLIW